MSGVPKRKASDTGEEAEAGAEYLLLSAAEGDMDEGAVLGDDRP